MRKLPLVVLAVIAGACGSHASPPIDAATAIGAGGQAGGASGSGTGGLTSGGAGADVGPVIGGAPGADGPHATGGVPTDGAPVGSGDGGGTGGTHEVTGGSSARGGTGGRGGSSGPQGGPPTYDPPQFPPLSSGSCPFAVAPSASLCGGRAGCPVITDAEVGVTHIESVGIAPGPGNSGYLAHLDGSPMSHDCLLTLDSTVPSASAANVDLFPVPYPRSSNRLLLASDAAGAPHVFMSTPSAVVHFHANPGGGTFVSDDLAVTGNVTVYAAGALSARGGGGISVLYEAIPTIAHDGGAILRLASGDGSGTWSVAPVFDGGDPWYLANPTLAHDGAGQPVVLYETQVDSTGAWSLIGWRGGTTASIPGTDVDVMSLFEAAASPTVSAVVARGLSDGIRVQVASGGQVVNDFVVPNTAQVLYSTLVGCPTSPTSGGWLGCNGFANTPCTLTGQGTFQVGGLGLGATDDGAVWLVYYVRSVDADVVLREQCTTSGDRSCTCSAEVVNDRTRVDLRIARVPTTASGAGADIRLNIPMLDGGFDTYYFSHRVEAMGTRLHIAAGPGDDGASTVRYLAIDTARL